MSKRENVYGTAGLRKKITITITVLSLVNPRRARIKRTPNDCLVARMLRVVIRFLRLIADGINFCDAQERPLGSMPISSVMK